MAEEFGGGVCGGNWWNPSRSIGSSSPRSGINHCDSLIRNWEIMSYEAEMMKLRSCKEIAAIANPSRVSATALFATSPPSIWNHVSLGSIEECFLQETMDTCQFQDPGIGEEDDSSMKGFKQINQELSDVDQSGTGSCISTIAASCRGLPTSCCTTFPIASDNSSLMQSLLGLPVVNGQSTPPSLKPSPFQINNGTPYWNPSGNTPINDDVGDSFFASSPSTNNFTANSKRSNGDTEASSEPVYKRPRIETPSSLPTFKVRKEKLGDRVTALQQLVSPFGKTDTASVLHEAVEYIKFLHDQVNGLVTSHMKNGASIPQQQGGRDGLRSQGLCLVPISKTYAVANDIKADSQFWALPFGGTFG